MFLRFTHILNKVPLQPLKRDAKLETWYVKGVPFVNKTKLNARLAIHQQWADLFQTNISALTKANFVSRNIHWPSIQPFAV